MSENGWHAACVECGETRGLFRGVRCARCAHQRSERNWADVGRVAVFAGIVLAILWAAGFFK